MPRNGERHRIEIEDKRGSAVFLELRAPRAEADYLVKLIRQKSDGYAAVREPRS